MSKNFKISGVVILSLLIGGFLASYFTHINAKKIQIHMQISSELESLSFTLDALEYLEENMGDNLELRAKLENIMASNFLTISETKPGLINFKDGGITTLCRASKYKNNAVEFFGKNIKSYKRFTKVANEYLNSIEIELKPYCATLIGI